MSYNFRRSQIVRQLIRATRALGHSKVIVTNAEADVARRMEQLVALDKENGIDTFKDETTYSPGTKGKS